MSTMSFESVIDTRTPLLFDIKLTDPTGGRQGTSSLVFYQAYVESKWPWWQWFSVLDDVTNKWHVLHLSWVFANSFIISIKERPSQLTCAAFFVRGKGVRRQWCKVEVNEEGASMVYYLWYIYISLGANITNQLHRLLQYINKSTQFPQLQL